MLLWYAAGVIAAIVIAWVGALVHASGYAPIGLISLGVGVALGAAVGILAAVQRVACRKRMIVGTLLVALVAVLAEHAWLYHDFRRQWHEAREKSPQVAMFRAASPWSPREYFERELTPQRATLWIADAVLIATGAVATVLLIQHRRRGFCLAADASVTGLSDTQHPTPDT
jgi:hypothetical protein